ncbi:Gfo/Idh/MocA family protein [Parapedobacter tibetensis]|uniref:Gfo/Idh/MocA family protein n=1 Tax=Parapedobacter tibetensis TaxID=2972951 RepID=UPI00214DE0D0|nr:Gfo/Idh/MocA family oxidoreductase [Parapedobacter tibetensis]
MKDNNGLVSRRHFIASSSLMLAGMAAFPAELPFGSYRSVSGESIRLGIIGVGSRGSGIANILRNLPALEVVACCDIISEHLQHGLDITGGTATAYSDYRRLLDDRSVQAVIIALPEHLHYPVACAALDAGKHVYLEKTMAHSIEEADDLARFVKNYPQLVLQVGHQYRYFALYHKIAEIMERGWLGEVLQYECQYHRNSDWRRPVPRPELERQINWRMYKEYSGGLMTELCSHQVDIVNWLTGSHPLRVTAIGGIDYWKDGRETYDNIRALYEYPDGVKASVSSILSNAYKGYSLRILGTKATIEVQQSKAFIYGESVKKELTTVDGVTGATAESWGQGEAVPIDFVTPDGENRDPTAYALLDFAACIQTGKKPFSNVETGRESAIAVHLANKAADTGAFQQWPGLPEG